VSIWNIHYDWW